ncbi:O-methylsterigmatocystin oxidoreductase [Grifola frondosa]|uniref:O-methylsterigmatocystin oxidoreductase n=1 Tax=Grifola frondosa TaxID=5627 RepID=A0A1C7LRY9_GRIFR|nr:O-methylsterigmatocystin oxidoreductase [Grifola frondosa]
MAVDLTSGTSFTYLTILVAIVILKYTRDATKSRNRPLPPGPKPLPIIGNILDMPQTLPWITFRDWSEKYGDVVHIRLLEQPVVILGSPKAAFELLDKRSANYSDRARSPLVSLMGWDWMMAFVPYGQVWRRARRMFWQHFTSAAIRRYEPAQLEGAHRLAKRLLDSPDRFVRHIHYAFGSAILKAVHGLNVAENDDKYVLASEQGYVPSWVPGAGFQKKMAKWRLESCILKDVPFEAVKHSFKDGTAAPSVISSLLEQISRLDPSLQEEEEDLAKNVVGAAYGAGADTTFSIIQAFFLAMVSHPEVQRKARAELDLVVGPNRLPDFGDRDSLPYINAVVKESLRWQNVVPLGIIHRSIEEDEYNGYFIPAGCSVIANIWAFMHDPEVYPDPEAFIPERYLLNGKLNPEVQDPSTIVFGFGRRICPGRHFADTSLFINLATVLHLFDIAPAVDSNGEEIPVPGTMTSGFLSYPTEFKCSIKPRSASAEALIQADYGETFA